MKPIVLATTSKYKIELFGRLGLPFRTASPKFEEILNPRRPPKNQAVALATGKAQSLGKSFPGSLIIGTDQVLALGKQVFTKPGTTDRAVTQLLELSGKTHSLHSAFALWNPSTEELVTRVVTARLTFHSDFTPEYLREMVEADGSQDCVGGYKYESMGIFLMEHIRTSDTNTIVGLPLIALIRELQEMGYFPDRFRH